MLPTPDSMLVYVYADITHADCMTGRTIAWAYICQVAPGAVLGQFGRPVLGYVNLCVPNWQSLSSVLMHELVHLVGFVPEYFAQSFPNFALYDTVGRPQGAVAFARDHFGCGPGTVSSPYDDTFRRGIPTFLSGHMDPNLVGDDFMAGCVSPVIEYRFTEMTARILGDLGNTNPQVPLALLIHSPILQF